MLNAQRHIPIDILNPVTNAKFNFAMRSIDDHMTKIHALKQYPGQSEIVNRIWLGARELIMIHREFGKSTMAEDVVVNDLIYEKGAFVLYLSATIDSATDHTRAIKAFFEDEFLPSGEKNPLVQLKPTKKSGSSYKWSDEDFVLSNGNRCKALGLDKFMLGKREKYIRPTRIIVDDPVRKEMGHDEATISTFRQTVLPMGGPMTRFCVIGTPRRYADLIMTLKDDEDTVWNLHYFPAIQDDGTITCPEFWMRRGACCYDDKFPCGKMEGNELVLEHINMKKREVKSKAWATEYLLQPIDESDSLFQMALLNKAKDKKWGFKQSRKLAKNINQRVFDFGEQLARPRTVIGCDFAYGQGDAADFTVFTVLQCDSGQPFKVIDVFRKRGVSFYDSKQHLLRLCNMYKPSLVYVEANMAQVVFADDMIMYAPHIPIVKFYHGVNKNKVDVGIPSIKTYLENGSLLFSNGDTVAKEYVEVLFRELNGIMYKAGKVKSMTPHDDCVDSLWIALMAAVNMTTNTLQILGGFTMADVNYLEDGEEEESEFLTGMPGVRSMRDLFT